MNIVKYNRDNLMVIRSLVVAIGEYQYREPIDILSGASVGAHVRHILEFYICLLRENHGNVISYDERERNQRIETERGFALVAIDNIILKLNEIKSDQAIALKSDFSPEGNESMLLDTSLFRELGYCLEHSVHHEALIKIGVKSLQHEEILVRDFGVAPSTVRHHSSS
jgi:hypothetical protein